MLSKNTTLTIFSKFLILLVNFTLVVFSTRIWGSEGRGEIALVIANISIITIFTNVFCGSSVAFHTPRLQREFLFSISTAGAILISVTGALLFSVFFGFDYFMPLFLITLLTSLINSISAYKLGKNNIRAYNFLTLLSPVIILVSLAILYFIFHKTSLNTYFNAYYIGLGATLTTAIAGLMLKEPFKKPSMNRAGIKSILGYGMNNEFNYLLQFLNYRLSYYFIALFLGLGRLGVFSVVISISEAVWIISKSMSAIHFSNVINTDDQIRNRHEATVFAKQSLWISLIFLGVAALIPGSAYREIFGADFAETRKYILYLLPGIAAIAVSNIYGHYFAGTGQLKILRNKSFAGLAATLIFIPLLIKSHQLNGVCIALNISYILSSFYLWFMFHKEKLR